jgi:hypothetical protein
MQKQNSSIRLKGGILYLMLNIQIPIIIFVWLLSD